MIHQMHCAMAFMEMGSQIPPLSFQLHLCVVLKVHFGVQVTVCTVQERAVKMEGNEVVLLLNHTVCNL